MQICQKHWDALRAAIEKKGMAHLVAKDGEEAMARAKAKAEEAWAPYDPLMDCNMMIVNHALQLGGLYLLQANLCPICEAVKHLTGKPGDPSGLLWTEEGLEKAWIEGPTDAALQHCQKLNIL